MDTDKAVRTVSKNFLVNFAGALWQFILLLIGTRLVLDRLGADSFGILSLVGGTIGYFLYLDIGIGETVVKKVSEETDSKAISRIVSSLFFFSLGLGAALAALVALFALYGVDLLFSFEPELMKSCMRVFIVIAAGLWIIYPLNIFGKVFIGLQRLDVYNLLRVIFQTAVLAGIIAALTLSNSAEAAVAAITIVGIAWQGAALLFLRRMYPEITISPKQFDGALLRELLRYKSYATVSQAGGHIVYQCDIYMIGILMNPLSVTIYSIANIIAVKIAEASGVLGTALFPMISRFYGEGMHEPLRKSFLLSLQLMTVVAIPVAAFIAAYSDSILEIWVGPQYLDASAALKWLAAAWMLNAISNVSAYTLKAVNRPDVEAGWVTMVVALNLLLDLVFIPLWGVIGAVYATLFSQAVWLFFITRAAARHVKTDLSTAFLTVVKLMALGLLLSVVYMIEIPAWLFFVPLLLHAVALAGLGYLFVMDNEYRGYVKNIFSIIRARAL
jgi:O-antigen/teichoic acid export membrane protein